MAEHDAFLVTCEHGGNRVPVRYRKLFQGQHELLRSHRGYDPGALDMARHLAALLGAPLLFSTTSRLLIDLNRSVSHPKLYSETTRMLAHGDRQEILQRHYLPYRTQVEQCIAEVVAQGRRVVHLSSHSFTPVLDGEVRSADVGLLYDPARADEKMLCLRWQSALHDMAPQLKVRRNYPYRGTSDGFTAYLRRCFSAESYLGIELEINQQHVFKGGRHWQAVMQRALTALQQALREFAA